MAEIRPFAAIRYAENADLAAVTCPPYDVLSPAERQALIDRSPHAAARLILPEGEGDAKYQSASELWTAWQQSGVLREDTTPGLYVTRTEFVEPGSSGEQRRQRLGLVCLLRLQPYGERAVLPHERTLTGPKEDRLRLLRATHANFESSMGLGVDPVGVGDRRRETGATGAPPADFVGDGNQRDTRGKVEDTATNAAQPTQFAARPVYIADGHHRYETSLAFAQETGAAGTDRPEAFLLTTLSSFHDPGLSLLPTHRLVRGLTSDFRTTLFRHLEELFDVGEIALDDLEARLRLHVENQTAFGLALPSGFTYQVTARDASRLDAALPADLHPSLRRLDVTILQHLVLDRVMGIPAAEVATTDRLAYTRSAEEAIQRVREGEFDVALLLGHTPVEAVRDVSDAGEVMPQKSTFFYPKLLSGLVMRRMA